MSVIQTRPIAVRDPGPEPAGRRCTKCNCLLSRNNRQTKCAPCNGGDWDPPIEAPHPVFVARLEHEAELAA